MATDVLSGVDTVHANGSLKKIISENLDEYVIKEASIVEGLQRYIRFGKKFFILTNSEYDYTKLLLDYAINPFLKTQEKWQDLFEFTITLACKPRFFYDALNFLSVNPDNGCMTNIKGKITPGIYQGGYASKFTNDLMLNGDEILYIGDHIYGDILRLKKDCNWRTALVVEELGSEIESQIKTLSIEKKLHANTNMKKKLEQEHIKLFTKRIEEQSSAYDNKLHELVGKINNLDQKTAKLLEKQRSFFNPKWVRVFRAGAEESYFAYQVDRFACIYMEKLSDLFQHSPLTYFRAKRRLLAHDTLEE